MIYHLPIRRLTADERDRKDAQHAARYEELTAQVEAEELAEYDRDFGATYKALHPYKPDGSRVHFKVIDLMHKESLHG